MILMLAFLFTSIQPQEAPFEQWTPASFRTSYYEMQKVAQGYLHAGYSSWLTYGETHEHPFHWQVVPFKGEKPSVLTQIEVLWHLTFSSPADPSIPPSTTKKDLPKLTEKNPFIDPNVIAKQLIYAGKEVYLLYNYAPLTEHHFLVIPKREAQNFLELTEEEYLEAEELAQKVVSYYSTLHGHLLDKNGKAAGQTVPHWHQHLIFTEPGFNEWVTRLHFALRMVMGASPLSDEELHQRVEHYQETLGAQLSERI